MLQSYLFIVFIAACFTSSVWGDVYMQNPRGNNDRLNEATDRQNANRLFRSENNARGGYCWGPALTYYEGSILPLEWTNQHSCGSDNAACNMVIQYMCSNDGPGADPSQIIRDGLTTTTIPTSTNPADGKNYYNYIDPAGTGAYEYGMNEPVSYYQQCTARSRNKGLFTADQAVANNKGAQATRQSPNGARYGFECGEEGAYYPYWHPSPWKDIAVLVNDTSDCAYYQANSQNTLAKNYCYGSAQANATNNEADCKARNGTWATVAAYNLPLVCEEAPRTRDNHLGNGVDGTTAGFNWTIPRAAQESCINNGQCACVVRLRYNISIAEVPADADAGDNGIVKNNPTVEAAGFDFTLALNTAQTARTFQDRSFMFRIAPRPTGVAPDAKIYNLNVRGKRGNIVQTYPATEYDFVPTHLEVEKDDLVHFQWTGCDTNPAGNAGEGTAQTDRSNIVQIASMNHNIPLNDTEMESVNALFKDPVTRDLMANLGQTDCKTQAQLQADQNNGKGNVDQNKKNCQKLNAAGPLFAPGVSEGTTLVKMSDLGTYYYMSTRNNNFSNRSQKASISVVASEWAAWKTAAIVVGGVVAVAVGATAGTVFYAKRNPHSRAANFISKIPGLNRI